jgi:hypothetical protein
MNHLCNDILEIIFNYNKNNHLFFINKMLISKNINYNIITHLDLYKTKLKNYDVLLKLVNLKLLDLCDINISSTYYLQNCIHLIYLNLDNCYNIKDFTFLSKLVNLQKLNLDDTKISIIPQLSSTLKQLNLWRCRNLTDFSNLVYLTNLIHLELGGTNIKNISFLRALTKLEVLHLDRCVKIIDFRPIAKLTNLYNLSLDWTLIRDLSICDNLLNLHMLSIYCCELIISNTINERIKKYIL